MGIVGSISRNRKAVASALAIALLAGVPVTFAILHDGFPVSDVDLEARDFSPVDAELDELRAYVSEWVPGVDPGSLDATPCLYGALAEDDFLIDRDGDITVAAGFSGHGFKFVPLVGRMVADLVTGSSEPEPRFTRSAHQPT